MSAVPTCCCQKQQYYVIDRLQLEALATEQPRSALGDGEWTALPCLGQQEPVVRMLEALQRTALLGLTDASGQLVMLIERQQLQDQQLALEETQARFQLTMEVTNTGLWYWDLTTQAVSWSDQAYRQLGYTPDKPMSLQVFQELMHPQDLQHTMREVMQSIEQDDRFDVQFRLRHQQGHWVWIQGRGKVTSRDEQGQPLLMMGTHIDISPLKNIEQDLQQSRERLLLATESACLGIWDYDMQTGYLNWDAGMLRLYGLDEEDFHHQVADWQQHLLAEEREQVAAKFEQALASEQELIFQFNILAQGQLKRLHCNARIIRAPSGEPVRVVGINHDITEQAAQHAQLQQAESKFRGLFEGAPVGMAMNDFATG